ncbi:hypothetical protein CBOS2020_16730 [Clostridium botulinum]|nr:hypothetical protein CBOS2020_16730 [Clostridium botulinum]
MKFSDYKYERLGMEKILLNRLHLKFYLIDVAFYLDFLDIHIRVSILYFKESYISSHCSVIS